MKSLGTLFSDFKLSMFKNYGENPGKMLVHTGVLGWILSSLAQVSAVIFNDKISPEQKSFLVPQEIADAAINIISFYAVTNTFKNVASKLVSTGKLSTKPIRAALKKLGVKNSDIGKYNFNIGNIKAVEKDYKPFKNGVEVIASVIGSIISCNIVTPIFRNKIAASKQKQALAKKNYNQVNYAPRGISMNEFQNRVSLKYSSGGLKI